MNIEAFTLAANEAMAHIEQEADASELRTIEQWLAAFQNEALRIVEDWDTDTDGG